MALRADLVGLLGREVAPAQLTPLLLDEVAERLVELAQQRHPLALAPGDLVELLLHLRGEVDVDEVAEVLDEQVGDDDADRLGPQTPLHRP